MIYADYNGSAPLCDDVKKYLINRFENGPFANPNSIHFLGRSTFNALENARSVCGKILNASHNQIIFNSGATEGISTVFHSLLRFNTDKNKNKNVLISSGIEHAAIVNNLKEYAAEFDYTVLKVETDPTGKIKLNHLEKLIKNNTDKIALVTLMAANNETGVIQPYLEMAQLCCQNNIKFLCDTTQLIGKMDFDFKASAIDFAVCSGHKFGALTGAGILLAKNPTEIRPLIIGGGQENGKRGGTQHYLGYESIAVALTSFEQKLKNYTTLNNKRVEFEKRMKAKFPSIVIMGEDAPRLATTTLISFPGVHGQAVQIELEAKDIFVTTSSACSDNEPETSKVLKAMGIEDNVGRGVVRISLGLGDDPKLYDKIGDALLSAYTKLSKISSF